jgi:hypothetical protein
VIPVRRTAALGLLVLAAGCGVDTPAAQSSPSATVAPSVSASPSAVPAVSPIAGSSARASATPGPGSKDFGYVVGASGSPVVLRFDRAVLLTGEAAQKAAAAHGEEAFDYYVQNDNTLLRSLPLSSSVVVRGSSGLNGYAEPGGSDPVPLKVRPLSAFVAFVGTPAGKGTAWNLVYGPGGTVSRIDEQYFP